MPFKIIRNDITKIKADAIVNTANPEPVYMAGTDAAIYRAAGEDRLLEARRKIGTIGEGMVAVTPAFDLDARYIFHTVGPSWQGGGHGEADTVRCCYENCLAKAAGLEKIGVMLARGGEVDGKRILSEDSVFMMGQDQATRIDSTVTGESPYGLCTLRYEVEGVTWYGHQGRWMGLLTDLFYFGKRQVWRIK